MKQLILLALVSISAFAADWPTSVAGTSTLLQAADNASTTLSDVIDSTTLTIPVTSSAKFVTDSIVVIGSEQVKICSVGAGVLTACSGGRAVNGTAPASHAVNTSVKNLIVAAYHNGVAGEVTAVEQWLSDHDSFFVSMEDFSGVDCGDQINKAYAALPSSGGRILIRSSCTYSTPINFATANKVVILQGLGNGTKLHYSGTTGNAITFNNGILFDMSTGLRDVVVEGPGNGVTGVSGVVFGGTNGCVGCSMEHVKIQSFFIGFMTTTNTWITRVSQSMIRDNRFNFIEPSGQAQAGENVQFDHVTFADAVTPFYDSVWIQGGGQETVFTDCSFDHAGVRIGNGGTSAAQIAIKGSHFENPNFVANPTPYDYITMDNHNGNSLRLSDDYFLQDNDTLSPAQYLNLKGGKASIIGIHTFSPGTAHPTSFALLSNAVNVDLFSFNDLGGNIPDLLGGSTTGYITQIAGANTAGVVPRNIIMKSGDTVGGAQLDLAGTIRASNQIVSLATTGTAPFVINSTTPVNNLFAQPASYDASGNQLIGKVHVVMGTVTLAGDGTLTINLVGAAQFANSSSYTCVANDISATAATNAAPASGTQFVIHGTAADNVSYVCVGN